MPITYVPEYRKVGDVKPTFPDQTLLEQQGMFGADLQFAYDHATEPLKLILDAIPEDYLVQAEATGLELNIDARVHELWVGDYPASPGWHCDAPQRETVFSDKAKTTPVKYSLISNVSSHPDGVSNTVFAKEGVTLQTDTMDYAAWQEMDKHYGTDLSQYVITNDGELLIFSPYTPHCIQPAKNDGVRMFVRISQWKKPEGFTPGLTKSEQVYRMVNFG